MSQWVWNLRLELGHQLEPTPLRTTEFAPAILPPSEQAASSVPASGYGPPTIATSWKTGRFSGQDFPLQPDGTLRCPAGQSLSAQERRREADGSLRVVYGASIRSCRPCPLREQCQWQGSATKKPRQVSVLLHPLAVGNAPLLWRDWSRREHRRACLQLVRDQHIEMRNTSDQPGQSHSVPSPATLSRAPAAHVRLSWAERLTRNARAPAEGQVSIKLFGVPDYFANFLGLRTDRPLRAEPHGFLLQFCSDSSYLLLFPQLVGEPCLAPGGWRSFTQQLAQLQPRSAICMTSPPRGSPQLLMKS